MSTTVKKDGLEQGIASYKYLEHAKVSQINLA